MPTQRATLTGATTALLGFLASGCLGAAEAPVVMEEAPFRLTAEVTPPDEYGERSLEWAFANWGGSEVAIGCGEADYCDTPPFRVEAEQADGSWVERESIATLYALREEADAHRPVMPNSVASLHRGSMFAPGTFRAIARVATPSGPADVVREFGVVGWSEAQLERARELLARADAAGCTQVSRNVFSGMLYRTEPDATLDLFAASDTDDQRDGARWALLQRGSFAAELARDVRSMTREQVVAFGRSLERTDARAHGPVRDAVAERLIEALDDHGAPLELDELRQMEAFAAHWPVHAVDAFVVRLAEGPDEGESLAELIQVITYARPHDFFPARSRLLDILEDRCEGSEGPLLHACENARATFGPNFSGLGTRGFGHSWGCGGSIHLRHGVCSEIGAEWAKLEAEPLEVVVLGGAVLRLERDLREGARSQEEEGAR